jgi:hypothetical protein
MPCTIGKIKCDRKELWKSSALAMNQPNSRGHFIKPEYSILHALHCQSHSDSSSTFWPSWPCLRSFAFGYSSLHSRACRNAALLNPVLDTGAAQVALNESIGHIMYRVDDATRHKRKQRTFHRQLFFVTWASKAVNCIQCLHLTLVTWTNKSVFHQSYNVFQTVRNRLVACDKCSI